MTKKPVQKKVAPSQEIGVAGLKVQSGLIYEEYDRKLVGAYGRKIYREMANDATVGACLAAIQLLIQRVDWNFTGDDEDAVEFAESLFADMSHTREDFLAEALSMNTYGWAYHEIVYKRRVGPLESDAAKRSKHTDGRIGIRKLAPRSQDTLTRWEMDDDGGINGMWQRATGQINEVLIPIERALLFRTTSRKNSPEGVSLLRTAYEPWYKLRNIQNVEAIGIERELAGLPIVRIPNKYLSSSASGADATIRAAYEKIARDLKFNEQGGLVIPSDPWTNKDGTVSSMPLVDVKLISSSGARTIDTGPVVDRYQKQIARSVLADFLMLGSTQVGSFALSKSKTDLFLLAVGSLLRQIFAPINMFLLPRVWDLNGFPRETMPTLEPGDIAPVDLAELGSFLTSLAGAGAAPFPDDELENYLRTKAGLPERTEPTEEVEPNEEDLDEVDDMIDDEEGVEKKRRKGRGLRGRMNDWADEVEIS